MGTKGQARIALNGLIRKYNELRNNKEFAGNEVQVSESLIKPFVKLVLGLCLFVWMGYAVYN